MAPEPEESVTAAARENAPDTASKVSAEADGHDTKLAMVIMNGVT